MPGGTSSAGVVDPGKGIVHGGDPESRWSMIVSGNIIFDVPGMAIDVTMAVEVDGLVHLKRGSTRWGIHFLGELPHQCVKVCTEVF